MKAFLKAIVLLPVCVVAILFAIANRGPVLVSLDPFTKGAPEIAITVPLYAIVLAAVALGVVVGGVGAWLSAGGVRRANRLSRREAHRLRGEADKLRRNLAATRSPALPAPRGSV